MATDQREDDCPQKGSENNNDRGERGLEPSCDSRRDEDQGQMQQSGLRTAEQYRTAGDSFRQGLMYETSDALSDRQEIGCPVATSYSRMLFVDELDSSASSLRI